METIIGLLFILLPVIFKLIGKRLEQSETLTETLPPLEEDIFVPEKPESFKKPAPQQPIEAAPVTTRKPMLQEEEPQKKGQKIDPKKLVIYSEIMKPKF